MTDQERVMEIEQVALKLEGLLDELEAAFAALRGVTHPPDGGEEGERLVSQ